MRLSLSQIKASLPEEKREEDRDTFFAYYIMRPGATYPAWLALRLGFTANQVTFTALIVGLIACTLFFSGNYMPSIIGALLVCLHNVLDYTDGTVARATNTSSKYGIYLDRTCDNILRIMVPISIGVGLNLPILGLVLALLNTTSSLLITEGNNIFSTSNIYRTKAKGLWWLAYTIGINIQAISTIVLLATVLANILEIYLWAYITINTAEIIAIIWRRIWSLRTKEQSYTTI